MKLDPAISHYNQSFGWVGHEDALGGYYKRDSPPSDIMNTLVKRRYDIDIIGGVEDKEASYSYDDWALCKLDNDYYLLSTSGCSCPSPSETWSIEIGPATLNAIRDHVTSGNYDGYTLPKKQESDFLSLIDGAILSEVNCV